jgi:hypothetical protein
VAAKSSSKVDKVVRREICSVQTKGTKRLSFIDGDTCDSGSQFLFALCEKVRSTFLHTSLALSYSYSDCSRDVK